MTLSTRVSVIAVGTACYAIAAGVLGVQRHDMILVLLAFGIVLGEVFELRPLQGTRIATSYAVMLVLLRAATTSEFFVVVGAAELVAMFVRDFPASAAGRFGTFVARCMSAAAGLVAYEMVVDNWAPDDHRWVVVAALAAASFAQLLIGECGRSIARRRFRLAWRDRSAEVTLVACSILMALGYDGVDGKGEIGLWSPVLFSIPLFAAWYSFERLRSAQETYEQTIRALSAVPELGGHVLNGHATRVTELCVAIADEIDFPRSGINHLVSAALLHHIGEVTLDDPEHLGRDPIAAEVAVAGAELLRSTEYLSPAGDIVHAATRPYRGFMDLAPMMAMASQILKVASDFDDFARGERRRMSHALESLHAAPGFVYSPRVLSALERILLRDGSLLHARAV